MHTQKKTYTHTNKFWQGLGDRGTFHFGWQFKAVQPLWKNKRFLTKLNIDLPYDPVILPLCIYLKDSTSYGRDTGSTVFLVILFTITRKWKQPRCSSIDE